MKKASASTKPAADVGRLPAPGVPMDDPTETPYPGYAREAAALAAKVAAAKRSQAAPLPGPLREAFAGEPRRVVAAGKTWAFEPVCAWLVAILVRIESPMIGIIRIYREYSEELKSAASSASALGELQNRMAVRIEQEIRPAPDAALETVFAFLTPAEKCQELLDINRLEFTVAARKLLGKLHPLDLAKLERGCGEHFSGSFATALNIGPVPAENTGGEVFLAPPPEPMTDSVGG